MIKFIDTNSFETVVGTITFNDQNNEKFWTVGQWQDGVFVGVNSEGRPGAQSIIPKSAW